MTGRDQVTLVTNLISALCVAYAGARRDGVRYVLIEFEAYALCSGWVGREDSPHKPSGFRPVAAVGPWDTHAVVARTGRAVLAARGVTETHARLLFESIIDRLGADRLPGTGPVGSVGASPGAAGGNPRETAAGPGDAKQGPFPGTGGAGGVQGFFFGDGGAE